MKRYFTLILFMCSTFCLLAQNQYDELRYRHAIFNQVSVQNNVEYGSAPQWVWPYWNESLKLDIYQPVGDVVTNRPLIIFAHAGGFLNGSKNVDNMVAICDSFARKGYVTASLDYRKGFNPLDGESAERAVYRGVQDGKAAVRYFKQNAALYGIDTNFVYFGGMSAGGFMALHVAYMDLEIERPASTYGGGTVNNLGCWDCAGNTFNHSSKIRAVLNYWGAIQDTVNIAAGDVPILQMHGTDDPTVPFVYGQPFGLFTLPYVYGSEPIKKRVNNLGIYNEFYTSSVPGRHMLDGSDNGTFTNPPVSFWYDTLLPRTTDFLVLMTKNTPTKVSSDSVSLCFNEATTFEVNGNPESYYKWMVHNSGTAEEMTSSTNTLTYSFQNSGSNLVSVVEFNEVHCSSDTLWFFVNQRSELNPVQVSPDTVTLCFQESTTFEVSGTVGSSYEWTWHASGVSGVLEDTTNSIDFAFMYPGSYDISVVEINGSCSSETLWFHVIQRPELNLVQVSSDTVVLCNGEITALVVSGNSDSHYEWRWHMYGSSGIIGNTSNTINFAVASGGNAVDISVIEINDNCISDTVWFHLIQQPEIVASFNYQINGHTVTFLNTSENGDFSSWNFGDGETSTLFAPTHTYSADGTYTVSLTMEDSEGCSHTLTQTIVVQTLSLETLTDETLSIYPNPFENSVYIQNNSNETRVFDVMDANGKIVLKNLPVEPSTTLSIDTQKWLKGIYFIHPIDSLNSVVKIVK